MASEVVGSELYRRFGGEGSIIYSGVFKVHDNQCNRCVLVVVIVVVVVLVVGIVVVVVSVAVVVVVVVVVVGSNSNNSSSGKVDARKN
jgi:Ca2+/Na+ antiporter